MANRWGNNRSSDRLFSWAPKSLHMVTAAMKLKDTCSLGKKAMTNLDNITRLQRHYFADKGPYCQSSGFSSSPIWMWELGHKESWALKDWCFWTVVLEKTLESALESKEFKPVHPKGNQPWIFFGRTDACASQRRIALLTTTRESLNTTMKTQQNQKNKSIKILKIWSRFKLNKQIKIK